MIVSRPSDDSSVEKRRIFAAERRLFGGWPTHGELLPAGSNLKIIISRTSSNVGLLPNTVANVCVAAWFGADRMLAAQESCGNHRDYHRYVPYGKDALFGMPSTVLDESIGLMAYDRIGRPTRQRPG
jgi:hypothetical protein